MKQWTNSLMNKEISWWLFTRARVNLHREERCVMRLNGRKTYPQTQTYRYRHSRVRTVKGKHCIDSQCVSKWSSQYSGMILSTLFTGESEERRISRCFTGESMSLSEVISMNPRAFKVTVYRFTVYNCLSKSASWRCIDTDTQCLHCNCIKYWGTFSSSKCRDGKAWQWATLN